MNDVLIKPYLTRDKPIRLGNDPSKVMDNDPLRENLRRLLEERGRSARSVSLKAGLSASAIKHILSGASASPGIDTLQRIATELGVPVDALTGEVPRSAPVAPLQRLAGEFIEDQAELRLLRYWRALSDGERSYILDLVRRSILGR